MGGNALSGRRCSREEMNDLKVQLEPILRRYFQSFFFVTSIGEKEDFGDIDIVCSYVKGADWKDRLWAEIPGPKHSNSNCHSFLSSGVQVDLIVVPPEEFKWASYYYSNNDLGNLIGRISRNIGFTFGNDGFHYTYRDVNYTKRITLTLDVAEALRFLGYQTQPVWFFTWDLMFQWVTTSPLFHPGYYSFNNRNHEGRHRDKKRPNYIRFLDWLGEKYTDLEHWIYFSQIQPLHLQRAFDRFYGFRDEYIQAQAEAARLQVMKQAFNGDLIRDLTGLEGKDLGAFIQAHKPYFEDPEMYQLSLDHRQAFILYLYANWEKRTNGIPINTYSYVCTMRSNNPSTRARERS